VSTLIAHHIAGLPEDLLLPLVYGAGVLLAGARVVTARRAKRARALLDRRHRG
jgi:hypothetical protein